MVLEILCDLQASADQVEEARRTCSELVEFNAEDPETRQRLGDLFLRHGWYAAAYRQYQSLVEMRKRDPQSLLRLATAAAGMGKVDEALRIERKVAEGEGDPGPQDPRRIARMHSAARLANLLMAHKEKKHSDKVSALESSLKRTQLFGTGSTLVLLVFEDFQSGLDLALPKDAVSARIAEKIQAGSTGLIALDLGRGAAEELALKVYATNESLKRQVPYQLITISWDGKAFTVKQKQGRV
jgi:tetratricopeptide (TPR) repeat protein